MTLVETYIPLILMMAATGILGGVMAGLLGIGGGIIIVPALEFSLSLLHVDPDIRMHIAVATSLATIIPTSLASARAHHRRGAVDFALARQWGLLIFLGAALGAGVASSVKSPVLAAVFTVVSLFIAAKLILPLGKVRLADHIPKSPALIPLPTAIGMISTMMGIGGGTLSVTALTLFNVPIHRAVGTAAFFGLLIAIPGTIGFMVSGILADSAPSLPPGSIGFVNMIGFLIVAPATTLAAPLGVKIAHALTQKQLNLLFALFLLVVSGRMLFRFFSG